MAPSAFPALKNLNAAQPAERAGSPATSKKRAQPVIAIHMMKTYFPTDLSHPACLTHGSRWFFSSPESHASGVALRLY
jgi:hypothetical protein